MAFGSSGGSLGTALGGLFCSAEDDTDLASLLAGFELQATVRRSSTHNTYPSMDRPSLMVNLPLPAKPDSTNVPEAGSTLRALPAKRNSWSREDFLPPLSGILLGLAFAPT